MNQFQEYMLTIKLVVFDYLCDTLHDNTLEQFNNFTEYIQNQNDLFLNNQKIFNFYKRTRFYEEDKILSYYGCYSIPTEYRTEFIKEFKRLICGDNNYFNAFIKNDCDEGTYDHKLLTHFWKNYAIHYISLKHFKEYYHEKLTCQGLIK
jgi:hypothetical protein